MHRVTRHTNARIAPYGGLSGLFVCVPALYAFPLDALLMFCVQLALGLTCTACCAMQSIMLGGAVYYGFLPKLVEVASSGAIAAAGLSAAQNTPLGLVGYGIVVSVLEFLPLGGVNPKEMSEYFGKVSLVH